MKKVRLQANFRIEEEDQEMIQALRRTITRPDGKVPSETDIWRLCLREIYDLSLIHISEPTRPY